MTSFEEKIISYATYCSEQITILENKIKEFPEGRIACYKFGKYIRYKRILPGRKAENLSKKNKPVLERMARKAVFQSRLTDYQADLKYCNKLISEFNRHPHAMDNLLKEDGICRLLAQKNPEADIQEWLNKEFTPYTGYQETLNVPTEAGFNVRSKSESMIVSALLDFNIPFRYESRLEINGIILHPDFEILRPKDRKIIYMEHFGIMDDPDYINKATKKLQLYLSNGYIPNINLICFYETKENPLSIMYVKTIIKSLIL